MIDKIKNMTLQQVVAFKEQISLSFETRVAKTKLYEACEEREKALNIESALVVRSEVDK